MSKNNMNDLILKISNLLSAHKQIVLYLIFGVCTTVINTVCYWLLYDILSWSNLISTVIAWLVAVIFAFITNKRYVFESRKSGVRAQLTEFVSFFGCRILTGILDAVIMAVAVDLMKWNGLVWKLISNIIVTVVNYIASKFLIFKGN